MIGQKVTGSGFCKSGVVKATRKLDGDMEVLVYWGKAGTAAALTWEKLSEGKITITPPEPIEVANG